MRVHRAGLVGMVAGFCVLFVAAPTARAQTAGAIVGVVRDATGAVLPGVMVETSSPALSSPRRGSPTRR